MKDQFQDFCDAVCKNLKHATPEERREVRREMQDHLEDHAAALQEIGYDKAEAEERAVKAMGDAQEIGKELNKQYPLLWLILSRVPVFLAILLCCQIFGVFNGFYSASNNIRSRLDPLHSQWGSNAGAATEVDYRYDMPGNDVLYIYAFDIVHDTSRQDNLNAEYYARISYCNYDKNPFGIASQLLLQRLEIRNEAGLALSHGGGGGNTGAHHNTAYIPVFPGEETISLDYSGFGFELHEIIPLNWEGIE